MVKVRTTPKWRRQHQDEIFDYRVNQGHNTLATAKHFDCSSSTVERVLYDKGRADLVSPTTKARLDKRVRVLVTTKEKSAAPAAPAAPTAADIADALLKRVVEVLHDYDNLLQQKLELKQWKSRALEAERDLEKLKTEKESILKIHNEQVKARQLTSSDELLRLAQLDKRKK